MARLFTTSGIRGIYGKKITNHLAYKIGLAIGKLNNQITLSRDTRLSGPELRKYFLAGISEHDCKAIDFSIVPTPILGYGTRNLDMKNGIMITASHNPKEYNGFKVFDKSGKAISRQEEEIIEKEIENLSDVKEKEISEEENKEIENKVEKDETIKNNYLEEIKNKFELKGKLKVLIDPADGAASSITPKLLANFNYPHLAINDSGDGNFPNRNPEPNSANLGKTCEILKANNCDIGFAHDGDADRFMPIDDLGNVVDFDKFLAFFSKKMLENNGSDTIITTVDAPMMIDEYLGDEYKVIRTKVGDVFVANEITKNKACFGGEPSGSYIFPKFGMWPDGIYGILQTLKFVEEENMQLSNILEPIQKFPFTRTKFECDNEHKKIVMDALESYVPEDAELNKVDGLLIKQGDSQILIRPSGTEPSMRLNVEAKNKEIMKDLLEFWESKIKEEIKNTLT
ncbi:phosphoglucosamine mutase [Nanoarchaeota archaeon]